MSSIFNDGYQPFFSATAARSSDRTAFGQDHSWTKRLNMSSYVSEHRAPQSSPHNMYVYVRAHKYIHYHPYMKIIQYAINWHSILSAQSQYTFSRFFYCIM